jgi:tRNA A37 threonylcarbamoyladenosine synthetase subunit TsaC/SUA5/YrdC
MEEHNAPLTCTSANVSGLATLGTVGEILQQFGARASLIKSMIDDGPRKGLASTIVRVIGEEVTVLREGDITESDIRAVL